MYDNDSTTIAAARLVAGDPQGGSMSRVALAIGVEHGAQLDITAGR